MEHPNQCNDIGLKSISELLEMKFFIPSYQRGYRWTEQQVRDLLDDIQEFAQKRNKKSGEFYCLQPIVVHRMTRAEIESNKLPGDEWYEVIDGQQRLTTIYLILQAMSKVIEVLGLPTSLFEMRYQRSMLGDLSDFLTNIATVTTEDQDQIDRFHISRAYLQIAKWKKENGNRNAQFCNALLFNDISEEKDSANNVRFIWYETHEESPVRVFTRLNIGAIKLTNAELIKALLLNRKNFEKDGSTSQLRQQEIASEWDEIEYTLQREDFWLFLNARDDTRETRIDFIFDLIAEDKGLGTYEGIGTDKYRTFRYFGLYFKSPNSSTVEAWDKVKRYFRMFNEWYNDIKLYHYVGFLIAVGTPLRDIIDYWNTFHSKEEFVKKGLAPKVWEKIKSSADQLDQVYETEKKPKTQCRPLLLFHNIQTVIDRNDTGQRTFTPGLMYRFPFHLYKREHWDVEHINSWSTNSEEGDDTRDEWLANIFPGVSPEIQEKIKTYAECDNKEKRDNLYSEIQLEALLPPEWSDEDKNKIWNYTLLDSHTNRSYGNAIFSAKRRIIKDKYMGILTTIPTIKKGKITLAEEKKETSSNKTRPFVPPCTLSVFLKMYSPIVGDVNYWTIEDAEAYLTNLENSIKELKELKK